MIKSCIFDLDGTLIDSMNEWYNCGKTFLRLQGLTPSENLSDILYKLSMADGVSFLKKNYLPTWQDDKIEKGIIKVLEDSYKTKIQLKPGAMQLLEKLKEKNIPCVLATATPRELFFSTIKRFSLQKYFKEILTCSELKTKKNEPLIYLKSAKILCSKPEETLVFEDALIPIQSAKSAGFRTIGVFDESSKNDTKEIKKLSEIYLTSLLEFDLSFLEEK